MIYLTKKQWDNRIKTIATKRLHKFRRALTATSMGRYFDKAVLEIQINYPHENVLVVDEVVYKQIRALFMKYPDDELRERGVINKSINAIGGFRDVI